MKKYCLVYSLSLKKGLSYALEQGAEKVLTMDSDGEHLPHEMNCLIHASFDYDLLIGNRFANHSTPDKDQAVLRAIEKVTGSLPLDARSGARVYSNSFLHSLLPKIVSQNYGFETESCLLAYEEKRKVGYMPISRLHHRERVALSSKKSTFRSAELEDLCRVLGRGCVDRGASLLGRLEHLEREFLSGDDIFLVSNY